VAATAAASSQTRFGAGTATGVGRNRTRTPQARDVPPSVPPKQARQPSWGTTPGGRSYGTEARESGYRAPYGAVSPVETEATAVGGDPGHADDWEDDRWRERQRDIEMRHLPTEDDAYRGRPDHFGGY
jgi:hypothetical protein